MIRFEKKYIVNKYTRVNLPDSSEIFASAESTTKEANVSITLGFILHAEKQKLVSWYFTVTSNRIVIKVRKSTVNNPLPKQQQLPLSYLWGCNTCALLSTQEQETSVKVSNGLIKYLKDGKGSYNLEDGIP